MSALGRFNAACERALGSLLALLVCGLVLTVVWQVVTRLASRAVQRLDLDVVVAPAAWTEELSSFGLAWVALLGAAFALRRGEHVGLDLLHARVGAVARRRMDVVVRACVIAFALLLLAGGGWLVHLTWLLDQRTPVLGWPMGAVYLALPLSGALMLAFACERVFVGDGHGAN